MKISNLDDIIDTRDILSRIDEIILDNTDDDGVCLPYNSWDPQELREHDLITALIEEIPRAPWGVTLIRDTHFADYIRDYCLDGGLGSYTEFNPAERDYVPVSGAEMLSRWPFNCIDWQRAAAAECSDYSDVEFDGVTYLYL